MSNLNKRTIVVTGGSGLIGRSILKDIIAKGGTALNFDLATCDECPESHFFKVDTTDQKAVETALQKAVEDFGPIHGFVNNAYPRTKDWGLDFEEDDNLQSWRENLDLQLNSYIACCQSILKFMKKLDGDCSIVNMSSIYGVVGNDFSLYKGTSLKTAAPYSAIKGGLVNFTRYFASKYGPEQIRMNCVSPGGIFDHQHKDFVERYEEKVPLGRMGNPDDIAPAVSFLLSEEARYITGQNLIVDGGWTAI